MKAKGIILGVIVLVVAIGSLIFAAREAAEPEETPIMEEENLTDSASSGGQLIQREPELIPAVTGLGGSGEAGSVGEDEKAIPGEEMSGGEVTISVTDGGFVPMEVTLDRGTTVTFVNDGQAPHWPASDVHPTHEVLPGFDAKRALQTGEEYTYTFTEPGEWSYHDHLNSSLTGKVVVE